MMLYKPVIIKNLQEIQDAVANTFPEMTDLTMTGYFTLPKNKVLEISNLRKLLKKLGLFAYLHVANATVAPAGYSDPNKLPPYAPVIHIDKADDNMSYIHSFNIPIKNCENTFVNYYKAHGADEIQYTEHGLPYRRFKAEECELIDQVEMSQAHIIDTSVPHAIVNPNNKTRILLAIRLTVDFNFDNFQSN
jgi:hypothetical protein